MTTPTLTQRAALEKLIFGYVCLLETARNRIRDYGGKCDPLEVMEEADPYLKQARAALAAQPELPEPVSAQCRFIGYHWSVCTVEHHEMVQANPQEWPNYETRLLYTEQAQAKREPMSDPDLARLFREIYGGTRFGESERLLARAIEAHHHIGNKA